MLAACCPARRLAAASARGLLRLAFRVLLEWSSSIRLSEIDSAMAGPLLVTPLGGSMTATWTVPGSKSMTNRGLVLAALSEGTTTLHGVLHSDDTRHMANALVAMGIEVENVGETTMVVRGGKSRLRRPEGDAPIFIGNSGTTVRFLAALAALVPGPVTFQGDEHMAKRPISDLVDALRQLDIQVECPTGCPPLTVHGSGLPGGAIKMPGTKSSQYFSALLLSAGLADGPLSIEVIGELVSRPYVRMTIQMVEDFNGVIEETSDGGFRSTPVTGDGYVPTGGAVAVEPDASSASYPFAVAAATGSTITVPHLNERSLQGDYHFVDVLGQMGCTVVKHDKWTKVPPRPSFPSSCRPVAPALPTPAKLEQQPCRQHFHRCLTARGFVRR